MPQSGLSSLKRAIDSYFQSIGRDALVLFGLRARNEWARSRVVIIPGHFDGSNDPRPMTGGPFGGPLGKASTNPRELARWERAITFSVFAVDKSNVRDLEVQNQALEDLVEDLQQAIWFGVDPTAPADAPPPGMAGLLFGDTIVMAPPIEGAYGNELLQQATMMTPQFARPQPVSYPSPLLKKVVLAPGGSSGTNAAIASASSGLVAVNGLGGIAQGSWVGQWLTLAGANIAANNGTFPIVGFTSPSAVVVQNPAGISPDPANGSITWQLDPLGV